MPSIFKRIVILFLFAQRRKHLRLYFWTLSKVEIGSNRTHKLKYILFIFFQLSITSSLHLLLISRLIYVLTTFPFNVSCWIRTTLLMMATNISPARLGTWAVIVLVVIFCIDVFRGLYSYMHILFTWMQHDSVSSSLSTPLITLSLLSSYQNDVLARVKVLHFKDEVICKVGLTWHALLWELQDSYFHFNTTLLLYPHEVFWMVIEKRLIFRSI